MALIQLGNIITDIRGKVAGTVFSKGPAGNVIRNLSKPAGGGTSKQFTNRATTSTLAYAWLRLTAKQREDWNQLALDFEWTSKLGNPIAATGYQVFLYCNRNLFTIGEPVVLSAPSFVSVPLPIIAGGSISASRGMYSFDIIGGDSDNVLSLFSSPQMIQPGKNAKDINLKFVGAEALAGGDETINFYTDYSNNFPPLADDLYINSGLKYINKTTGISSKFVFIKQVIG